jgi:hypothetical protein
VLMMHRAGLPVFDRKLGDDELSTSMRALS